MTKRNLYYISTISLLLFYSCIDPYDVKTGSLEDITFVDAEISDKDELHIVKLSKINSVGSQLQQWVDGATVILESDKGNKIVFNESAKGNYVYKGLIDTNISYKLDITLSNDQKVYTQYQSFTDPFAFDTITNNTLYEKIQNTDGRVYSDYNVHFFANAKNVKTTKPYYLRFDVETVFILSELICSPFITPKSCFVYNHKSPYDINLLEIPASSNIQNVSIEVFDKVIGYEMGGAFSVKVDVLSFNPDNYNYWVQLKNLFDQSGSITDLIPARFAGNILSDNENNKVIGMFSLVRKTSIWRVFRRGEVGGRDVEPFCGTPGFYQPWPIPNECCDCLLFDNSTIEPPYYW